eukprot:3480502-Rhodomonas_salina.1
MCEQTFRAHSTDDSSALIRDSDVSVRCRNLGRQNGHGYHCILSYAIRTSVRAVPTKMLPPT